MKKTIITVFGVIITLVLAIMVFNILTGGGLVASIATAVSDPINKAWKKIAGNGSNDLIDTTKFNNVNDSGVSVGDMIGDK